jgi:hypothetical protein
MPSPHRPFVPNTTPPVHQHRDWRHLQRAAVEAHRALSSLTQKEFCAHLAPAASIALWILQHAPELAGRHCLHVLVSQATSFEALDRGRWLQFIPWLLGRPDLELRATLVCSAMLLVDELASDDPDAIERAVMSKSWVAVRHHPPARLYLGKVKDWLDGERAESGAPCCPDLCAVFTPSLSLNHETLLGDDGLRPLLQMQVPLALFSPTEAEQLADVYTLAAAGLVPRDAGGWPNPWAIPMQDSARIGAYAKVGWAAQFDSMPSLLKADPLQMAALTETVEYMAETMHAEGDDTILTLGEQMLAAPAQAAGVDAADASNTLWRLPQNTGVDAASGYVYQIQDSTALLLEPIPRVPETTLRSFPGHEELLRRAIWAVRVHRRFVAPFVRPINEALASQFAALEAAAIA